MCQEEEKPNVWFTELGYWVDYETRYFKRKEYLSPSSVTKRIPELGGVGIFQCAYCYDNTNLTESNLYGDFYLDFDSDGAFELARADALTAISFFKTVFRMKEEDIRIYFSGKKGLHLTIPAKLLGVKPHPKLNLIFKELANHIYTFTKQKTLDLVIYDNRRLLRIPGTIHEKTGLYKTRLSFKELKTLEYEEIVNLAKQSRPYPSSRVLRVNDFAKRQFLRYQEKMEETIKKQQEKAKRREGQILTYTPPCIEYLLQNGIKRGGRNNAIAVLASHFKARGCSQEEAIDLLLEWNASKISQSLTGQEVKQTVKSIYSGNRSFGCSRLKELSICTEEQCKLKGKR